MAVTQKQIDALRSADAALDKRLDAEVTNRANADTSLANRITTLEGQVKTLLAASGGSGDGTTPAPPNTSPPPTPDTTPPVISSFTISAVSGTGATLACITNEASTVVFEYGLTTAYGSQTTATTSGTSHSKTLTGLTAGRTYHVRARATDTAGNGPTLTSDRTFNTPAPLPPSGETVALFPGSGSNSSSAFRALVANMSIDVIEMTTGSYPWNFVEIAVDRTARPLTIRPVAGNVVTFTSPGGAISGVFVTCKADGSAIAKRITFDGLAHGGFVFDGQIVAQAGLLAIFGSDYFTFRNFTVRNMRRGGSSDQPYKSWVAYVAGPYGRNNDHVLIEEYTLEEPAVNRDVSAFQVASNGTHGAVTFGEGSIDGYYYAFWADRPVAPLTLHDWAVSDCGSGSWSIRVETASASGSYSNITATASDGLRNLSPGAFTDGGGNSGL